jgi:hypothetical protein
VIAVYVQVSFRLCSSSLEVVMRASRMNIAAPIQQPIGQCASRSGAVQRGVRFAACLIVAAGAMGLGTLGGQFDHVLVQAGFLPASPEQACDATVHAASGGFVPYSTGSGVRGMGVRRVERIEGEARGTQHASCGASGVPAHVEAKFAIPEPGSMHFVFMQLCAWRDGGFAADAKASQPNSEDMDCAQTH